MLSPHDLFNLSDFAHAEIFEECQFAWEALGKMEAYLKTQLASKFTPAIHGTVSPGAFIEGEVYIGVGTVVEAGALIYGPTIIGRGCQVRHGAYIRGQVIMGDKAIVGHASEVKNAIFLNRAQAPHFAYVGDSILGSRVNLGAGTKLANVSLLSTVDPLTHKRSTISLRFEDKTIDTGLSKLGAILGDDVQIGCNSVTNPGCIIGPRTFVYALTSLKSGYHPADSIIKLRQQTTQIARRK